MPDYLSCNVTFYETKIERADVDTGEEAKLLEENAAEGKAVYILETFSVTF